MKKNKVMSNNYEKIYNSIQYARDNNIKPADPNTWDDNYRRRQQELAGIITEVESEISSIKEGIEKNKNSEK